MNNIRNKNSGITLIALIVTIIVLIILAGVAISMLSGQNGVINRSTEARYSNVIASFNEQIKLANMAVRTTIESDRISKTSYIATSIQDDEPKNLKSLADEVAQELGTTALIGKDTNEKINTEGYTVVYYLDKEGNSSQDGNGYIVIWYTDNALRSSINRDDAISKNKLQDTASIKSVNQAVLAAVISVENYNCSLSQIYLTCSTDADNDIKEIYFKNTTLAGENNDDESHNQEEQSNIIMTDEYIMIDNVRINVEHNMNTWSVPQYGTTINSGYILKSSDYYVVVRDNQYIRK